MLPEFWQKMRSSEHEKRKQRYQDHYEEKKRLNKENYEKRKKQKNLDNGWIPLS